MHPTASAYAKRVRSGCGSVTWTTERRLFCAVFLPPRHAPALENRVHTVEPVCAKRVRSVCEACAKRVRSGCEADVAVLYQDTTERRLYFAVFLPPRRAHALEREYTRSSQHVRSKRVRSVCGERVRSVCGACACGACAERVCAERMRGVCGASAPW